MPTLSVCQNCRDTCAKCHKSTNSSHPVWACLDCSKRFGSKCPCCGENKKGFTKAVGAGKVCNSCYKMNRCTFCGSKI